MAMIPMRLEPTIVWDDNKDTATLTLVSTEPSPPPPPELAGASWYPGRGDAVTLTVPIKRGTTTTPRTAQSVEQIDGQLVYGQWEYHNGAWINISRTTADGTPYTGD
jgi:hypothetical protein